MKRPDLRKVNLGSLLIVASSLRLRRTQNYAAGSGSNPASTGGRLWIAFALEHERCLDMEQIVEARIKASSERLERLRTEILSRDNSGVKDREHGGKEICTDPGDKEFMRYATKAKGERGTYLFSRLVGTYWSTWRDIRIQDEPLRSQLSAQRGPALEEDWRHVWSQRSMTAFRRIF